MESRIVSRGCATVGCKGHPTAWVNINMEGDDHGNTDEHVCARCAHYYLTYSGTDLSPSFTARLVFARNDEVTVRAHLPLRINGARVLHADGFRPGADDCYASMSVVLDWGRGHAQRFSMHTVFVDDARGFEWSATGGHYCETYARARRWLDERVASYA